MENALCAFSAKTTRTHISRRPFFPTSITPVILAGPLAHFSILDYPMPVNDLPVTPAAIAATRRRWL